MPFNMRNRPILTACSPGLALVLVVVAGCVSAPSVSEPVRQSVEDFRKHYAYQTERSPAQIDASATVEASATCDPDLRASLSASMSEQQITNHLQALSETLTNDIVNSGLFARIQPISGPKADYLIKIFFNESRPPDWVVRVTLTVVDSTTLQELSTHTRELASGAMQFTEFLPGLMTALKADMVSDLIAQRTAQAKAAEFQKAALVDLLAGTDKWVAVARERNHALVAAKIQQLPAILRESKTDELTALLVKIEQTILDLNHEAEVAKDRAQQATANPEASSDRGATASELRDLSISYRERIELLKPIAAAIKEEIANRNR
jgi:hypothetical protein